MDNPVLCVGHHLPADILVRWLEAARKIEKRAPSLLLHIRALQHHVDDHALRRVASSAQKAAAKLQNRDHLAIAADLMADVDRVRRKLSKR